MLHMARAYGNSSVPAEYFRQRSIAEIGHTLPAPLQGASFARDLSPAPHILQGSPSQHTLAKPSLHTPHESLQRLQDAQTSFAQDSRIRTEDELLARTNEALLREVDTLREQIREEQDRRATRVADLSAQLNSLLNQNKEFQIALSKLKNGDSSSHFGAITLKREVVVKTMELEKLMREFQQTHQDKLFGRVSHVVSGMLQTLDLLASQQQTETSMQPADTGATVASLQAAAASAVPPALLEDAGTDPSRNRGVGHSLVPLDADTQHALKRRLQSLGDVIVFTSEKFDACCASGRGIPPGALRIRPRRCDHVFLVECLMPYWAEGLCPVCRCSFAYSRARDAGFDDCDRYSSVSTSVSQSAKHLALPQRRARSLAGNDELAPGGAGASGIGVLKRGPKTWRPGVSVTRSSSHGTRSDGSGACHGEARAAGGAEGGGRSVSPPRSVISAVSSAQRSRPL